MTLKVRIQEEVTTKSTKDTKNCILRGNSSRDDVLVSRDVFNPEEKRCERGLMSRAMPFVLFVSFVVASL
jgi:hypothetical protein